LGIFRSKFESTTFLCFQKEMQVTLPKPILTRVNYMLPLVFLIIIINLSHGTNLKPH